MSSEATTSSWLATYMAARAPITVVTPELSDSSRRSAEPHLHFRRQNGSWLCARLAAGLNQSPRVRTRIGSLLTPSPPRRFRYFPSASRATADRSRELCRPSARHLSTRTSLPDPRRKLLAMWPVRVARSPHLDMLPQVVRAGAQRQRPYDKDVLKNKDFLNRRLYSTIRSDHQHGPNAMSRCAYVLVGFG